MCVSDRVIVWANGVSGSDRSQYIKLQQELARENGNDFEILKVADFLKKVFEESNLNIEWNNILNMNESQLKIATYAAYKEIDHIIKNNPEQNYIIDGHGKFWWNGFPIDGFHPYFMREIKPDLCVSIIDNEYEIKKRLNKSEQWKNQNLNEKDILRWIADEVNVARLWADFHNIPWHVIPRKRAPSTLYMLMFHPERKKVYFAFPMTHAFDDGISYDAQTNLALKLVKYSALTDPRGIESKKMPLEDKCLALATFYRDLNLWVTQNQMIFVFYATPVPSIGAASEVLQARFQTKDVYIVWPEERMSFFTIAAANRIFKSEKEFLDYFVEKYDLSNKEIIIPEKIINDAYLKEKDL